MTQAQYITGEIPPAEWTGGATPYPRETSVHRLFEEQPPAAVALLAPGRSKTYGELNSEANRLARHLQARGLRPGAPVALCLDRSPELIVALLGILKAGCCYVPLDPGYPAARLRLMAEDCAASLLLTTRALAASLPDLPGTVVFLDDLPPSAEPESNLPIEVPATAVAYIMFTSGSTGRPKGVAVPHRAIVRLVRGQDYVHLDSTETFLQLAPASFDASTLEIWGPLLNGGRLAIAPPGQLSLEQIAEAIRTHGVTAMWLTSGLFNLMADERPAAFAPLRQLIAGGDLLSVAHVRKAMAAHPRLRLVNGYGPTESTTFACCHAITAADLRLPSIPIGKPIANTTVRILDGDGRQVPIGVPGELHIGGDGLAIGYWNQPALTAEKFVSIEGERYYRTGDRVQWLPAGAIQFLGREDHQVKIRGFRVELGEIENALAHLPGIQRCAVIAIGDTADKQLAAYYTGPANPATLRASLRLHLPDHMVPSFFTRLDSLPLTENGKVDRARLPSLHAASTIPQPSPASRTPTERALTALWSEIIPHPTPGPRDNFFDLGGTSLKLVEAHSRLVRSLRRQIPVTALFQYPTIASLAAYLDTDGAPGPAGIAAAAGRARAQREALARKQLFKKVP